MIASFLRQHKNNDARNREGIIGIMLRIALIPQAL
jgi:hypothetical protein